MTWNFLDGFLLAIILDLVGAVGILTLVRLRRAPCLCRLIGYRHRCA